MIHQANFLQSLGWAVLNSLWQLALLWVLYQFLTTLFRTAKPAAKSVLASSLLILGFAWFVYTFFVVFGNSRETGSSAYLSGFGDDAVRNWLDTALPVASVCYIVLLFPPLFRFIRNYRYVQVLRSNGLSKIDPVWRLFVNNVATRMGIPKPVQIWISEWVTSPVTIGYLKPVILVPLAALNQLTPQQMEAVLLHELSHIRRFDYLLNLVLNLIRTILYFNPFARAFVKIVEREREKSCDEMVLQFQYDSHEYASALLCLEKVSREQKMLLIGASGNGQELLHRVETIMGVHQKTRINFRRFSSVLAALFCIAGLQALLLFSHTIGVKGYAYQSRVVTASAYSVNDHFAQVPVEINTRQISNHTVPAIGQRIAQHSVDDRGDANPPGHSDYIPVGFNTTPEIFLDRDAEAMVKEAVQSSRKVLEGAQWKAIEKELADAFNEREKEYMKSALRNEFSKFNWGQWENKLRMAYDQVDWEQVNNQLTQAVTLMRTDSLMKVYNDALVSLNQAQKEMQQLSIKGIPDSDISLKAVIEKKQQLQSEINRLKSNRNRKTVHL